MTEKKNGDYEKPESHGEGESLEGVSGGASLDANNCGDGPRFWKKCDGGSMATEGCKSGPSAGGGKKGCSQGSGVH